MADISSAEFPARSEFKVAPLMRSVKTILRIGQKTDSHESQQPEELSPFEREIQLGYRAYEMARDAGKSRSLRDKTERQRLDKAIEQRVTNIVSTVYANNPNHKNLRLFLLPRIERRSRDDRLIMQPLFMADSGGIRVLDLFADQQGRKAFFDNKPERLLATDTVDSKHWAYDPVFTNALVGGIMDWGLDPKQYLRVMGADKKQAPEKYRYVIVRR